MEEKEPINKINEINEKNESSINIESNDKEIKREQDFVTLLVNLKTSKN